MVERKGGRGGERRDRDDRERDSEFILRKEGKKK